jgi:p-hydroxybenzoate 3-monooxygenase
MLSHLLHLRGIESIVIESQSRAYCEQRVRAGLLEQGSVDLLVESGAGERLQREALVHHGIELCFNRCRHRINLFELTGRTVTIYGQQEVVKDLIDARLNTGGQLLFEAEAVGFDRLKGPKPVIRFQKDGELHEITCDFIAGCDGFHGVCRSSIPAGALTTYERVYPFGWLGILAEVPPASQELVYANHERGFALLTMRSLVLSRLYLQCAPDESLDQWPDARIWEELNARCTAEAVFIVRDGPIIQKSEASLVIRIDQFLGRGRNFGQNSQPTKRIDSLLCCKHTCGYRRAANTMKTVTTRNEVTSNFMELAVLLKTDHRFRPRQMVEPDCFGLK